MLQLLLLMVVFISGSQTGFSAMASHGGRREGSGGDTKSSFIRGMRLLPSRPLQVGRGLRQVQATCNVTIQWSGVSRGSAGLYCVPLAFSLNMPPYKTSASSLVLVVAAPVNSDPCTVTSQEPVTENDITSLIKALKNNTLWALDNLNLTCDDVITVTDSCRMGKVTTLHSPDACPPMPPAPPPSPPLPQSPSPELPSTSPPEESIPPNTPPRPPTIPSAPSLTPPPPPPGSFTPSSRPPPQPRLPMIPSFPSSPPPSPPPPMDIPSGIPSTPATAQTTAAGLSSQDVQDILQVHNQFRAVHSAPPLVWSDNLAQSAQQWGSNCVFEHSPYMYGENIAAGSNHAGQLAALWYNDEVCKYDYSNPGWSEQTGHFTQVVWRSTTSIGCAMVGPSTCPAGIRDPSSGRYWTNTYMLICEYNPPGNYAGQYVSNVLPPLTPLTICNA